ncbi:MAG: hypothetical protein WED09_08435 [Homoserinimonas sp.]
MALNAAAIYRRHPEEHRLDSQDLAGMYDLAQPVRTVDEFKLLNLRGGPMVIISASGMLTGGRVLHHIAAYGSDPANAIVLADSKRREPEVLAWRTVSARSESSAPMYRVGPR